MIILLFLGATEDILETKSSLNELGLMFANEPTFSQCSNITNVELKQGTFDDIDLEVYDNDTTVDNIETYEFPQSWHKFIVFYANFNNHNLTAGNFDYMIEEIKSLIIKRRPYNSVEAFLPIFEKQIYTNIDTNEFNFSFTDYLVQNHKEYEYKLVPILKNGVEGLPIYASYEDNNNRKLNFQGLFICEPNSVYSTIMETEITANKDIADTVLKPLGREYSVVFRGSLNKSYIGTAKGLFAPIKGDCGWDFENAWEYRDKFNDFLLDKKSKILKSDDGRIWLINVYDQVTNEEDNHKYKVITTFNWVETGNVNDVYTLYDNGFISYNPYTKALEIANEFDYSSVIYTACVLNSNKEPITNATIKLFDTNNNVINTTQTNERGQFSFSKLRDGEYFVTVNASAYYSKTVPITILNHKVNAIASIILMPISSSSEDTDRNYLTNWKVLKSLNNSTFEVNSILQNNTIPSELTNDTSENVIVVLDSDFYIKKDDVISLSIKGNCDLPSSTDGINKPICSAILYTGISDYEEAMSNYNEIVEISTEISESSSNSSSKSSVSNVYGDVKLLILLEGFEKAYSENGAVSIIDYLSISINGINIFEMR